MELEKQQWGKKQPGTSIEEVFKKLDSEMVTKFKKKPKVDEKTEFRMQQSTFKSNVMRNGGYVYNNLRRTTPLNDGKYNVKYNYVFTREKETDFKLRQPSEHNH